MFYRTGLTDVGRATVTPLERTQTAPDSTLADPASDCIRLHQSCMIVLLYQICSHSAGKSSKSCNLEWTHNVAAQASLFVSVIVPKAKRWIESDGICKNCCRIHSNPWNQDLLGQDPLVRQH